MHKLIQVANPNWFADAHGKYLHKEKMKHKKKFFTSQRLMGHLSIVDGAPWLSPSFLDLDLLELHELLFELLIDRVREVFFKGSSSRR